MSDCLPVHARTSVCARVRVCLSVCLPACRAVGRSVGLSVCLSVCASVSRTRCAFSAICQDIFLSALRPGRQARHAITSPKRDCLLN